ncbi:hypothetical protein KCA24_31070, partial [Escherichia coli]|nr:hypothetical protein [Escherichia coli]
SLCLSIFNYCCLGGKNFCFFFFTRKWHYGYLAVSWGLELLLGTGPGVKLAIPGAMVPATIRYAPVCAVAPSAGVLIIPIA